MNTDELLLEKIDILIAATRAASVPFDSRWLDVEGVAALLGYGPRHVMERIACRPDFPSPLRVNGTGHPRWKATEVLQWAEQQRKRPSVLKEGEGGEGAVLKRRPGPSRRKV